MKQHAHKLGRLNVRAPCPDVKTQIPISNIQTPAISVGNPLGKSVSSFALRFIKDILQHQRIDLRDILPCGPFGSIHAWPTIL